MPSFTPPVDDQIVPPLLPSTSGVARLLFRHYRPTARGRNVWIINGNPITAAGGTVTENDPTGYDIIVRAFYGGHGAYQVSAIEAALLTAAGYTVV